MLEKLRSKFIFFFLGGLIVVAILVWTAVWARAQNTGELEVHFFDVGQGKAIFIEEPSGVQILIDGGPDNSVLAKLSSQMPFYDRDIDLLILTHPDSDHLNGLVEVLKRYIVDKIIETGMSDSSAEYQAWHNLIKEKNIPVVYALAGQTIKIGDGFVLEFLYPNRSLIGQAFSNTNDSSIVTRLDYGQASLLLTGDTEQKAETYLVGSGQNIDVDILDISHHGSKNATGQEFIDEVTPEAAVIQVGANNRYGHPAQETLDRLKDVKIYRTDLCGDVDILSDGQKYQIEADCL